MTAVRPPFTTLRGCFVQLQPLSSAALPELHRAIAHRAVFESGYGGGLAALRTNADAFITWARDYFQWESLPYVVRLLGGINDGDLVGTTTLGDLDLVNESAQLGWTAYDPRVWGTAVNTECKLLLLTEAFRNDFGRITIQADSINTRSREAIEGIGATFEGVLRRNRVRADGSWRDTAMYSILVNEWPDVRARLQARVGAYPSRSITYRSVRRDDPAR
ncbi:GNAT family N-acetyltransferase [Cryobacterium psychrophilum]|uniref:N-acetyltransferase n=1 Tax=Cryobacterium psychrophilum TaxID=41988 RepID=A0A4Y8KLR0_9MICO|nr:GNAT family protein [Cryobacterium psychrophilum]TDW30051.1 RimJ/RimL family protein N-acetyltransferase [Cryobacterium psychrophilum]TFD75504.1 N-acetyltransferase [Cryobacterium psychrophilum]